MRGKQKKLFNYAIIRKICLCLMKNSFLAILLAMLISRKPVQRRGIGEKCGFFSTKLVCNVKEKLIVDRLVLEKLQTTDLYSHWCRNFTVSDSTSRTFPLIRSLRYRTTQSLQTNANLT